MSRLLRPLVRVTATGLAGALTLAACTSDDPPPREPAEVALAVEDVDDLTIGLLVSSSSPRGEGSDHAGASAGAELAAYRLRLAGSSVEVKVVDDRGSADRAREGVQQLADEGVSGLVLATSGSHALAALDTAAEAGLPVVAPYLRTTETLPEGVWLTGPSEDRVAEALGEAMTADEVSKPVTLAADDLPVPAVGERAPVEVSGATIQAAVDDVEAQVRRKRVDSVVVSGSAATQAQVVAALQGAMPDVPVYLTPEALSPVFGQSLEKSQGTTAGRMVSVGAEASDATTLGSTAAADSAAAYFAALRLAAADEKAVSGLDQAPFAEVADEADLPSHDALVALVRAAEKAGSTEPGAVRDALAGLTLDAGDALAGPALDFGSSYALPAESAEPLYATTQDPGVRPPGASPVLTWFALPDDGE